MRCVAVLALGWALTRTPGVAAQWVGSVGAGIGTVRTSDAATAPAITIAPSVQFFSAATAANMLATIAALPEGEWNTQLRLDLWQRLSSADRGVGLAIAPSFAGSAFPGDARAGVAQLLAELLYQQAGHGVALGAGPALSAIGGSSPEHAVRIRARAWLRSERWQHAISIDPSRLDDDWYTDAAASSTFGQGPWTATLTVMGRTGAALEHDATAAVFAAWRATPRVTIEGGYGGFMSDPFLGFGRATSANLGARVALGRVAARTPALVVARRVGARVLVRVRLPGATSVAIAGEWTRWTPVQLRRTKAGGQEWEGDFDLAPGTYRFNLLVDGVLWTLPAGVATVPDELGGRVALLVVPPR